jgi:hypothetical protein
MDAKDFIELVIKHGWPVIIALAAYRIVNLVFDWLSQAEHVGMLKVLFNRRRQQLEKMLALPYLSRKTRNLARAELNQMARKKLTGFSDPRIQEQLTEICSRFSLPPRYFTRWRAYLSGQDGCVIFARRRYQFAWGFFKFVNLPASLAYLFFICYLFVQVFGLDKILVILVVNISVWYLPWLFLTSPMAPPPTREMEAYIDSFNASREGE